MCGFMRPVARKCTSGGTSHSHDKEIETAFVSVRHRYEVGDLTTKQPVTKDRYLENTPTFSALKISENLWES